MIDCVESFTEIESTDTSPVTSLLSILNNIFVGDSDKCRFRGMTRTQGWL